MMFWGFFKNTAKRTQKEFDRAILRVRSALADLDNDGTPDAIAELAKHVSTTVNLLEELFPSSGKVRRGAEKLTHFNAKLAAVGPKWELVRMLIESAVFVRNARR